MMQIWDEPLTVTDTAEFGVPRTSSPPRYNYLGADELPTELSSGIVNMGARTYVPALGRLEQTDPQPGGSGNAYAYTYNDPVNQADPSGEWTNTVSYDYEAAETGASQGLAETYTGPGAILPPPVNKQIEAEFIAHPPWDAVVAFESTIDGEGPGGATAARLHILRFGPYLMSPSKAKALGYSLSVLGTPLGEHIYELSGLPGWFVKIAEAATRVEILKVANDLLVASSLPDVQGVSISAWGSFRYGFTVDVAGYIIDD
jgi:RHS repeat-associated protein